MLAGTIVECNEVRTFCCFFFVLFFSVLFTDLSLTTKDKTTKGKGCSNENHQRLSAGVEDKEMDNLRKWFSDKLALGLGNKDLMEKPKVTNSTWLRLCWIKNKKQLFCFVFCCFFLLFFVVFCCFLFSFLFLFF